MKINTLYYDYKPPFGEYEEDISKVTVGEKGVKRVIEHRPQGDGDKWFYDIEYDNGVIYRTFNPYGVKFFKETV